MSEWECRWRIFRNSSNNNNSTRLLTSAFFSLIKGNLLYYCTRKWNQMSATASLIGEGNSRFFFFLSLRLSRLLCYLSLPFLFSFGLLATVLLAWYCLLLLMPFSILICLCSDWLIDCCLVEYRYNLHCNMLLYYSDSGCIWAWLVLLELLVFS